ncbi:MAG: glycine--tRNA ligase [Patescibacteria group bacterium]
MENDLVEKIVALCKRRGFVFPGSEIYGGLANSYAYGPLGVEMLRNIKNLWWSRFVHSEETIYGLDSSIIMHPKIWEASGHIESFDDALVECKECHGRFRADHLVEDQTQEKVEGKAEEELAMLIQEKAVECPDCGATNFTPPRGFNLLFETSLGSVSEESSTVYLRGETAQGMFVNYKNVLDSMHPDLPFGIAQIGKAFRNEITLGNFIFRTFEFEQMEIEYFIREKIWEDVFEEWKKKMMTWLVGLGVEEDNLRWRQHTEDELSHYSQRTEDIEYNFPFGGFKELYGLAYRTDYDLKKHAECSGEDLRFTDSKNGEKLYPHVVEPTFGVSRTLLVLLLEAYQEEGEGKDKRTYLKLDPRLAPYKIAVFPLVSNKPEIVEKARKVYNLLSGNLKRGDLSVTASATWDAPSLQISSNIGPIAWDDRGNIGKRYYAQDEIGTPWCVTVDYDSLEDEAVTIRDRDTTEQVRIKISDLCDWFVSRI